MNFFSSFSSGRTAPAPPPAPAPVPAPAPASVSAPEPTQTSAPAPASASGGEGLSKSQRKRKKKNASKAKKVLEETKAPAPAPSPPAEEVEKDDEDDEIDPLRPVNGGNNEVANGRRGEDNLNPHEKMMRKLMELGYDTEEVNKAIEEMWNLQLQYDDFHSILAYLETMRSANEEAAKSGGGSLPVEDSSPQGEVVPEPMIRSSVPNVKAEEGKEMNKYVAQQPTPPPVGGGEPVFTEAPSSDAEDEIKQVSVEESAKPPPPPSGSSHDLASKLSVVANHENLLAAVTALREWVTKAAKQREVAEFCDPKATSGFVTVIRRSVLERVGSDNAQKFPVLVLVEAILQLASLPPEFISSVSTAIEDTLEQTHSAISADSASGISPRNAENIATTVAEFIASTLAGLLGDNEVATREASKKMGSLEKEIEGLSSALASNGTGTGGVVDLMSRRDCHKLVAEKYATVMDVATSSSRKRVRNMSFTSESNFLPKASNLLPRMLGDDYDAIMMNRTQYDDLKAQANEVETSATKEARSMGADLARFHAEIQAIDGRLEELKLEMTKLQAKRQQLTEKVGMVSSQISVTEATSAEQTRELQVQLQERSNLIRFEEVVRSVAAKLENFENSVLGASSGLTGDTEVINGGSAGPNDKKANMMSLLLVRMRNYFRAEADIIEFLQVRVLKMENSLVDLKRELEECKTLGMTSTVSDMATKLQETRRNIEDDNGAIQHLRSEAEGMVQSLTKKITSYETGVDPQDGGSISPGSALASNHLQALNDIKGALSRIGIDEHEITATFVRANTAETGLLRGIHGSLMGVNAFSTNSASTPLGMSMPTSTTAAAAVPASNVTAAPAPTAAPVHQTRVAVQPRMGWATVGAGGKKSIVDIQREEIMAKEDTVTLGAPKRS